MTTPVGSGGAVDTTTPTPASGAGRDGTGYGGAELQTDAPDVAQGAQHVPGQAPRTSVLDGPATMQVRKPKDSKSKGKK